MQNEGKRKKFNQPYTFRNSAKWIQSGQAYFRILADLIDQAKAEIHLQTYILAYDETGKIICDALLRAAERQVKIYMLVDAYGSQSFPAAVIIKLADSGIHFRKYGVLYSRGRFHIGRRLHRKVIVIDGTTSMVGGMNISDHYNSNKDNAWLDFAVLMEGQISRKLQLICRQRWIGVRFKKNNLPGIYRETDTERSTGNIRIRVRRNDFIRNHNEIAISYRQAIRNAEKLLWFVGGYFLPGGRSRRLLKSAIKRGVEIRVLVSARSDVPLVFYARRYLYDWLLRNNIRVFEYTKANVHGKVLIQDKKWTTIGSYDLNNLSTYSNIELNVDIDDNGFSRHIGNHLEKIMAESSREITQENFFRKSSPLTKLFTWFCYRFVKTLFVLSVILAGKKERDL
jgi:cardiolipin synthase A/B